MPVKALAIAKSRFAERPTSQRRPLALAFALDTIEAALGAADVEVLLVVASDPQVRESLSSFDVVVIDEPVVPGLNVAVRHGAKLLARHQPAAGVVALCADLPALKSAELSAVLLQAGDHDRSFLADAAGSGTTLLSARPGIDLDPQPGRGCLTSWAMRCTPAR